jgi:insulysin
LIGHEGDGSLLSYLKKMGLASELVSGEKNSAPGFNFFTVDLEITIEGLSKFECTNFSQTKFFFSIRSMGTSNLYCLSIYGYVT